MNLFKIARRNITVKPLNTILSLVLLAFGVGIISLLIVVENRLQDQFDRNIKDIDLVLGAKGSPLQLILANVYHIDVPTGNISRREAERIMKHPYIESGIPLAYGDNYAMHRIVGTTHAYHEHYEVELTEGVLFDAPYTATIGAAVAQTTGLKIGDTFYSAHGLKDATDVHADHAFTVVGIYAESGSVIDQLILTPMESVWGVHVEEAEERGENPEDEITAVLLKKKNALAIVTLPNLLRETNMQIALPSIEINRLQTNFGIGMQTLRAIALLIMAISFVSVFISLYTSLRDRRYELALMRTMGASRFTLFALILLEGMLLTLAGIAVGLATSRVGLLLLGDMVKDKFRYEIADMALLEGEYLLMIITIFVGVLASLLPAIAAVRIDISKTLADG
jgi:putative ABC transport system permease protein